MAQPFNLTAQINLRGPSNLNAIVSDIRNRIRSINANINLNINQASTQNVTRLNAALVALNRNFADTSNAANRATNAITNFGNVINNIQLRNLPQAINNTNNGLNNLNNASTNVARNLTTATSQMENFGKQSALAVRRFAAFSVVTAGIYSLNNAISQGIKSYIDYNKEIVRLQQVTGESANGLKDLENQISNLAIKFGVSSNELTTISLTLAQAGLSARDTEKALKALALSSLAPSFDSMNDTVEGSIALMKQFDISAGDLEQALGSINAVAAKFAVEAGDIITAIQRTGGVFATASRGVSEGTDALNEFISVFTSVRATTRESAETIATGLRTIFTRIQRGSTIEALKEYGVNLTDLDGKFVGAYKAVELLSQGLSKIDPRELRFSKIVEELGGFRQIGKVIPLIQQFSTAQEALKTAQTGQSSLTKDAATAQLSLANQISKVREEFLALFREIGSSTTFQVMIKGALDLTSAMIKVADTVKEILPVLGTIFAFRGAMALRQFATGFMSNISGAAPPAGRRNFGGYIGYNRGGMVNALLTPGEAVIEPQLAKKIGRSNLDRMNHADKIIKRNKGGGVKFVPGFGDGDTFGPIPLEEGSYVIRKKAVEAIGGPEGIMKAVGYKKGGDVKIKKAKQPTNLPSSGDTEFTHIYTSITNIPKKLAEIAVKTGYGDITRLYTNMGLDLPKTWNRNWAITKKDNYGAFASMLSSFIERRDVFKSLKSSGKIYRFTGRSRSPANEVLKDNAIEIRKKLSDKIATIGNRFFDIDPEVSLVLPSLLKQSVDEVLSSDAIKAQQLMKGFQEISAFKTQGSKSRQAITKSMRSILPRVTSEQRKNMFGYSLGGFIDRLTQQNNLNLVKTYKVGGDVTAKDVLDYMSISDVSSSLAKKGIQLSPAEIGPFLRKRSFAPDQQSILDTILKEAQTAANRQAGAAQGSLTRRKKRAIAKGLAFGAAGLFGNAFPTNPLVETVEDARLKEPVTVSVYGGIFKDQKLASDIDSGFDRDIERSSKLAGKRFIKAKVEAQKRKVGRILSGFETGRELNLDFDRTLAFGADKILADPRTPKFAEFGDRTKVSQALGQAKLSLLGSQLVSLVKQKPELLNNVRIITARPKSTLDLIQGWLTSKGLPIPLSQFKGFGGPNVSGSDIAKLKAGELSPGSIFVDDDPRNISAARGRSNEGISSYRYRGVRKLKTTAQAAEETESTKGNLLEAFIRKLGAVGTGKGRGFDFLNGLGPIAKEFSPFIPSNIPTDIKRTLSGFSTIKDNIVTYLKNVKGYNAGGEVPILAQEGEYVINRSSAQKIGYHNLDRLNKYHTGGTVRKFARGGSTTGFDPSTTRFNAGNLLVGDAIRGAEGPLQQLVTLLNELGITTSRTNELLRRGGQITYETATRAYETDLRRLRLVGSISQIVVAEQNLSDIRRESVAQARTRQNIAGIVDAPGTNGGQIQQNILDRARIEEERQLRRAGNRVADPATLARIKEQSFVSATQQVTGRRVIGASGADIQQYIQQSMMDRKTLAQMDAQYITNRRTQLQQELASNRQDSEIRRRIANSGRSAAIEIERMVREEVTARRRTLNEIARSQGIIGPGGTGFVSRMQDMLMGSVLGRSFTGGALGRTSGFLGRVGGALSGNAGLALSLGLGAVAGAGSNVGRMVSRDESTQANVGTRFEKFFSTIGTGAGLALGLSSIPFLQPVAGIVALGSAAYAATDLIFDFGDTAKKASQEVLQAQRTKLIEKNAEDVANAFKALERDTKNIQLRKNLETAINQQTILSQKDANIRFAQTLESSTLSTRPERIRAAAIEASSSQGAKTNADDIMRYMENLILSGTKLSELSNIDAQGNFTNKKFQDLVKSISMADAGFYIMEDTIRNMDSALQEAERAAYFRGQAEKILAALLPIENTRKFNESMEIASRAGKKLADNFEKLETSISQSISANEFFATQLKSNRQFNADILSGKAKGPSFINKNVNILQNPLAYSQEEFDRAARSSSNMLGNNRFSQLAYGSLRISRDLSKIVEKAIQESIGPGQKIEEGQFAKSLTTTVSKSGSEFIGKLALGDIGKQLQDTYQKEVTALSERLQRDTGEKTPEELAADFAKGVEDIANKIGAFGKQLIELQQRYTNIFNEYIQDYSEASQKLKEAMEFGFRAEDIRVQSALDIRKVITGIGTSSLETQIMRNQKIGRTTGGIIDPQTLLQKILITQQRITEAKNKRDEAIVNQQTELAVDYNTVSQQNIDASNTLRQSLEDLANNTDVASAALEELSKIRELQKTTVEQAVGIATASPEENFRRSLAQQRLTATLRGQPTGISRESQLAFNETLRQTGDIRQARLSREQVRAQQRAETQQAFEAQRAQAELDLKNEQARAIFRERARTGKVDIEAEQRMLESIGLTDININARLNEQQARLLESFGKEMNIDFTREIKRLRDPYGADPSARLAADKAEAAANLQAEANNALKQLNQRMVNLPQIMADLRTVLADLAQKIHTTISNAQAGGQPQLPPGQPQLPPQPVSPAYRRQQQVDAFGRPTGLQAPLARASGGIVYANNGKYIKFEPKGTDTIPAMLTEGEFVVNAKATARHLPLLEAINRNSGRIAYLADGGSADAKVTVAQTFTNRDIDQQLVSKEYAKLVKRQKVDPNKYSQQQFQDDIIANNGLMLTTINKIKPEYKPDLLDTLKPGTTAYKAVAAVREKNRSTPLDDQIKEKSAQIFTLQKADESAKQGGFGRDFGLAVSNGPEIAQKQKELYELELQRSATIEVQKGTLGAAGSGGAANTPQEAAIEAINRREIKQARNAPDTRSFSERNFGFDISEAARNYPKNFGITKALGVSAAKGIGPGAAGIAAGSALASTLSPLIPASGPFAPVTAGGILVASFGYGALTSLAANYAQDAILNKVAPVAKAQSDELMTQYPVTSAIGSSIPTLGYGAATQGAKALAGTIGQRIAGAGTSAVVSAGTELAMNQTTNTPTDFNALTRNTAIAGAEGFIAPGQSGQKRVRSTLADTQSAAATKAARQAADTKAVVDFIKQTDNESRANQRAMDDFNAARRAEEVAQTAANEASVTKEILTQVKPRFRLVAPGQLKPKITLLSPDTASSTVSKPATDTTSNTSSGQFTLEQARNLTPEQFNKLTRQQQKMVSELNLQAAAQKAQEMEAVNARLRGETTSSASSKAAETIKSLKDNAKSSPKVSFMRQLGLNVRGLGSYIGQIYGMTKPIIRGQDESISGYFSRQFTNLKETLKASQTKLSEQRVDALSAYGFGIITPDQEVESVIRAAKSGYQSGKPAALLTKETYNKYSRILLELARQNKLKISSGPDYSGDKRGNIYIGKPQNVDILKQTFDSNIKNQKSPSNKSNETIGKALGYDDDSIKLFNLRKEWEKAGLDINIIQERIKKGDRISDIIAEVNRARSNKPSQQTTTPALRKKLSQDLADERIKATETTATSSTVAPNVSAIENEVLGSFTRRGTTRYFDNSAAMNARKDLIARGEISGVTGYKTRFKPKSGQLDQVKELVAKDQELASMITNLKTNEDFLVFYGVRGDAAEAAAINARIEKIAGDKLLEGGASEYGDKIKLGKYGSTRFDPTGVSDDAARKLQNRIVKLITNKEFIKEHQKFSTYASSVYRHHSNDPQTLLYYLGSRIGDLPQDIQNSLYQGLIQEYRIPGYYKGGIVYANNGALISAKQSGTDTIPAMLTKGEFVVNRASTQSNLPILQAINSGHFNRGGIVNYLANGGIVAPRYYANAGMVSGGAGVSNTGGVLDSIMGQISALKEAFGSIQDIIPSLENVATSINTGLQSGAELLTNASNNILSSTNELRNMPTDIRITEQKQINIAGVSAEWNKYERDIINLAGENTQQKLSNAFDRASRRSEGQIDFRTA